MATGDVHSLEIGADALRRIVDPASLGFATTAELSAPGALVGQDRALESIAFALAIKDRTYNLYASGEPGTGRSTAVLRAVSDAARGELAGLDWCYVYHFEQPGEPLALSLPTGSAPAFARGIDAFVATCRRELRHTFTGESYRQQRDAALKQLKAEREHLLEYLQKEAIAHGFLVQFTPAGVAAIPLKRIEAQSPAQSETPPSETESASAAAQATTSADVEPMSPVEFESLPAEERQRVSAAHEALQETISRTLLRLNALDDEAHTRLHETNEAIARQVIAPLADALVSRYQDDDRIVDFVRHIAADIVAHASLLVMMSHGELEINHQPDTDTEEQGQDQEQEDSDEEAVLESIGEAESADAGEQRIPEIAALLRRYRVNVLVTHQEPSTAPVVQEINPTHTNLVGHIEFGLRGGLPVTDHLMLKPGAFHRANGGYLILHARDLFTQPNAWQAVKRTIRFGVISIEDGNDIVALPASASIRPAPIPVHEKVVLIGDPETYAILQALDPEFSEIFKVRADFDRSMPHTPAAEQFYAQFVGDVARCASLPPMSADAVALCIEEGSRGVEDQARLSTVLGKLRDLTLEAASFATGMSGTPAGPASNSSAPPIVTRAQVSQALVARERRMNLAADHINEMIREGTILIDTTGAVVGQINGLTVLLSGNYAFGMPARITARTAPGLAGIVNIERETMMSGPAHSKGILVLGGYLSGRFAHDQPLSLSATICLEQIYGEIEGDSASSAELYALLSSLSGLPLKQSLAVTGSVNQHGIVQAIGSVNEKIEGYFALCAREGLTGEQGVIIPRANTRNLMLRPEVIEAVRAGKFHIYAVTTIDEGIELLTGVPAGSADAEGIFPAESVNGRVSQTLHQFARSMREFTPSPTLVIPHPRRNRQDLTHNGS